MLRAVKQPSMAWIGVALASSLLLSLFLPTPIGIGMLILWAFSFYISLVLRKLLAQQYRIFTILVLLLLLLLMITLQ